MAKIIKSMSKNKVIKFDFFMIIITIKYENIIFNINMLLPKEYDRNTFEYFGHINNSDNDMTCIIKPSEQHYKEIISCIDEADKVCETFPAGYELKIRGCLYNYFFALNTNYLRASNNEVSYRISNSKRNKSQLIITCLLYISTSPRD